MFERIIFLIAKKIGIKFKTTQNYLEDNPKHSLQQMNTVSIGNKQKLVVLIRMIILCLKTCSYITMTHQELRKLRNQRVCVTFTSIIIHRTIIITNHKQYNYRTKQQHYNKQKDDFGVKL